MNHNCRLIGLAGGIGSGKSVISRILRQKGYQVYDCDTLRVVYGMKYRPMSRMDRYL